MPQKNVLSRVGEVITDQSKSLTINIVPANFIHQLLIGMRLMKSTITYKITPILVGNMFRVSTRAVKIPKVLFTQEYDIADIHEVADSYKEDLLYILAVCIQNNRDEPSSQLLNSLKWMKQSEFSTLLEYALLELGIRDFMKSIILIRGANVITAKDADVKPAKVQA